MTLLGAGASVDGGIPATRAMTRAMDDYLSSRNILLSRAFRFVCGQILADETARGGSPFEPPDVEHVFSAVELLANRSKLEATPFVNAWHPSVDALDTPISRWNVVEQHLNSRERQVVRRPGQGSFNGIDDAIRQLVHQEMRGGSGELYRQLSSEMTAALHTLTRVEAAKFDYLDPLFGDVSEEEPRTVATLNYDTSVETRGNALGHGVQTGIQQWIATGELDFSGPGLHLLKLHGSVDWLWDSSPRTLGMSTLSQRRVVLASSEQRNAPPAVIFGQGAKLTAQGPFLDLLRAFADGLSSSDHLIVIGYSFRDDHVNEYIGRWFEARSNRTIMVVDTAFPLPDAGRSTDSPFRDHLLALAHADKADGQRIRLIQGPARTGIAEAMQAENSVPTNPEPN